MGPLKRERTTFVQRFRVRQLHSTTTSTSSSGQTASQAGVASPPWGSPSSPGAGAERPAEMWPSPENFRVEQWNEEILLKALHPPLQAAGKTLEEARESPGEVTRWRLWSGETLVGRQPGQSRCGDCSQCGENEAKFGERWESQESQVCSNVTNPLGTNVMKVRPIMVRLIIMSRIIYFYLVVKMNN